MEETTGRQLEVSNRDEWRRWLAEHHASETEVWVVFRRGGPAEIRYGESVEEALCFGWIDGLLRSLDEHRYMRRFTPRRPDSKWSRSNKARVRRLQQEGRIEEPGRAVIDKARADGSWDLVPDAERDWEMPAELRLALERTSEAKSRFEASSPSHQRQFIMWVASAKRPETRQRRAEQAVTMLPRRPM